MMLASSPTIMTNYNVFVGSGDSTLRAVFAI